MIELSDSKLGTIRKYWRELCMIALAYSIVFLFRQNSMLQKQLNDAKDKEIQKKDEESKFWRDAFITTAKYNQYLQTEKDTTL